MSDEDSEARILAHARLEMNPEALTVHDVQLLGEMAVGLGVRGAVAFELRRVTKRTKTKPTTKTPADTSRRRAKR